MSVKGFSWWFFPFVITVVSPPLSAMCCLSCCDKFFNAINRFFNLLIALVGLALVGLGVFLTSKSAWLPTTFCVGLFAAGGFVFLTALTFLTCGHRSICCVSAYIYAMVLLVLADATGAGLVFTKKDVILRDIRKELNVTAGNVNLDDYITEGNIVLAGYSFAGLAGLQILAMMLAYFHRSHLIDAEMARIDLEDGYEQLDGDLIDRERGASRASRRRMASELPPRGGRGGGAKEEEQNEAQATTSKFRSKYANLYEKYGITPKD
jgi:hypothetical protein